MSNTFFQGAKTFLVLASLPQLRAWLRLISSHFRKCCETNISVTVCENVVPRLNKQDDVIEWKFMKIAPPPEMKNWLRACSVIILYTRTLNSCSRQKILSTTTWILNIGKDHHCYVYMVSFSLSRYHIWITSGLVLNVICWVSALKEPMRWPPRQEDVSLWSVRGLVRAVPG